VAVDDATLEAQAAMCRSFAERYRHVPGLIYYLNGDFRLEMKDVPDLRRMWNDMLRRRYGTDEALRAAWGSEAAAEPLGRIPVIEFASTKAFSERARDTKLFQAMLVERWVSALTKAIREADPDHPITSEYYQRPYSGIDLRLSMDGMDAANIGYFGPPRADIAQLLATIKWNDMRRSGKTVNLGEFGVKTHDAWAQERDPFGYHIGRTEEEQRRQLWWIVHAALAYDVTKIQNWCWADDPDSVFPWGVAYNNPLRPKPALRLWRNLRFVTELMPHQYEPAPTVFVMPDSWRLGAPEPAAWTGLASALECLLATNVRFDVVNEADIPAHAGQKETPRLVIAPFAGRMSEDAQTRLLDLARAGTTVYLSALPESGPIANAGPPSAQPPPAQGGGGAAVPSHFMAERTGGDEHFRRLPDDLTYVPRGKGQLIVSREAWESMAGHDVFVLHPDVTADPRRNLYLDLVRQAGALPDATVEAATGVWRATARKAEGHTLIALFARSDIKGPMPVTVRAGGHTVRWSAAANWPCLVVLNAEGGVLAATGTGILTVDGREIGGGSGPWMMASLDGKPVQNAARFVVSLTNGGAIRLSGAGYGATASVVELEGPKLRKIGPGRVVGTRNGCTVHADANDLVMIERQR